MKCRLLNFLMPVSITNFAEQLKHNHYVGSKE